MPLTLIAVAVSVQSDEVCEDELVAYIDNETQLWVAIATTTEDAVPVPLLDAIQEYAPLALAWNPMTGTLAFDGADGIYVISAASIEPERLVSAEDLDADVINRMVWSADGEWLAILAANDVGGVQDIYVVGLMGDEVRALDMALETEFSAYSDIVWSPDDAYLGVTINSQVGAFAELISTACLQDEGECVSQSLPVPDDAESSSQPVWLEDGTAIGYYCGSQFCISDASGMELEEVLDSAPASAGSASACGGQVLQAERGDLFTVDLETETRTLIASGLDNPPYIPHKPIWLPLPDAAFLLENDG